MNSPIFLDFQATTPLDPLVLEEMLPWLSAPANPHSVQHEVGLFANRAVEKARSQIAQANGQTPDGILFTPSATFACNQVIRSFARPGAKIAISAIEHPCVFETARACEAEGAMLEIMPVDEEGIIDLDRAYEMIEDADIVSVMAVNNETGTIQPIAEIAEFCRTQSIIFHTDAAQALGRIPLDEIGEEAIITLSSHKAYGPQGIGAISGPPDTLKKLKPLITGGGQQDGLHPGTLPTALCVGFGKAVELAIARRAEDWEHAAKLSQRFVERLRQDGVSFVLNGSASERIPHNLNISFDNVDADTLLTLLPQLALATGSACSSGAIGKSEVLAAMGLPENRLDEAIRVGFGRTTTREHVDEAVALIGKAAKRLLESA